jgi:carbon monoxide dehydrogenase subunit G
MELTNEFHVPVPVGEAWSVLTDVERIAPCMPGAQLEEIEGDEYRGSVKVKVGPITAQYKGKARFLSKDDAAHIAVLRAEGRDSKGQGNAAATITATLVASGTGTDVTVTTDLTVTGRVAQFGRGVMEDVSKKLLGQFVQCLEHDVLATPEGVAADVAAASAAAVAVTDETTGAAAADGSAPVAAAVATAPTVAPAAVAPAAGPSANGTAAALDEAKPAVRKIEYKPAEPVDLLDTAGAPLIKRAAPVVALLLIILWLLRQRKRG